MNHEANDIIELAKSQANEIRRLISFLETLEFKEVFESAPDTEKELVVHWLKIRSYQNIHDWYKRMAVKQCRLYHLNVKELRQLARLHKIQDYQYLRQWELIDELERLIRGQLGRSQRPDSGGGEGDDSSAAAEDRDPCGERKSEELESLRRDS